MIKLNWRDDESNWGTLLLSLAFLASLVFLSLLSAFCLLPRADPISHANTDTLLVTHTHSRRSATLPMPKHHPHGHILSPSSSSPVLLFSLLLYLSSCQSTTCTLTWSLTHTNTHPSTGAHTDSCACTDGEMVRDNFAGCWREQREGGEREPEKREGK